MNTGVISKRYAKALLMLVQENGTGDEVLAQVQQIEKSLSLAPEFSAVLNSPGDTTAKEKLNLLCAAVEGPVDEGLETFLKLVISNGRVSLLRFILRSFEDMYYRSKNIYRAHLTVPAPSPFIEQRVREVVKEKTGADLILETSVDPSIIGGFIFEMDSRQLDASVSAQLDYIRRQLTNKHRRIV